MKSSIGGTHKPYYGIKEGTYANPKDKIDPTKWSMFIREEGLVVDNPYYLLAAKWTPTIPSCSCKYVGLIFSYGWAGSSVGPNWAELINPNQLTATGEPTTIWKSESLSPRIYEPYRLQCVIASYMTIHGTKLYWFITMCNS